MNSEAGNILNERLAKGEISTKEYNEMIILIMKKNNSIDVHKNSKNIYSTLIILFSIGLTILFMLLGGDIIERWSPYTDRPFAFLFLFGLITNIFLGISYKWKKIGLYGAIAMSVISFLYFVSISINVFGYTSSMIVNILLFIHIVFLYIFAQINRIY